MKLGWWWILLGMVLTQSVMAQESGIARVDRILPVVAAQQADQTAGLFSEREFESRADADASARALPVLGNGEWRLQPKGGMESPLLVVYHPYSARVTVLTRPGGVPVSHRLFDPDLDPRYSRHALVFPLPGDEPIYVKVEDARYPLHVRVESRAEHAASDLHHTRMLMMAMGVALGVSLSVLLFWLVLRDRVYLLYAGSMLAQMLYVLCSYGEAYALPGVRVLAHFGATGIWYIATLATMLTTTLMIEYADLRQQTPRLTRWLRWSGIRLPAVALLFLSLPWPARKEWFPDIGNVLFLLTHALSLLSLALAWRKGSRHAAYFLAAWVPLMVFGTWRAVQISVGMPVRDWLDYGYPFVLGYASVVMALGLADRMLTFRRERDTAKEHAERDALTGVLNRGGIEYRLDWAILERRREHIPLSLLFIDLDVFKQINDRHGHAFGDHCLRAVTRVISEEFQYGDQLGRLGGEEFVLVLTGVDGPAATALAERVRVKIERRCMRVDEIDVGLTVSIGVAECTAEDTVASLIKRADEAMYRAKRAGGNQVVVDDGGATAAPVAVGTRWVADTDT
ncbi:sensor domain-containing diguanylate cyclase [Pseudoxanthomonas sp.]|jgi:diguanylate cyclase (GGDEF)-like protein|uniref:sensor domain-containing diguanylate cyclase n=1 Tax=Pseudoxanthomonas sp. TaxID=1871049 RepID=UPI003F7F8D1A